MKTLIDFLCLRPVWTRRGIEMVWYAFLLATLIELGFFFRFLLGGDAASGGYHLSLVYTILFALAHLALVRIFLEMALKYLIESREGAGFRGSPAR
jgi:hypothetical protein